MIINIETHGLLVKYKRDTRNKKIHQQYHLNKKIDFTMSCGIDINIYL